MEKWLINLLVKESLCDQEKEMSHTNSKGKHLNSGLVCSAE